MADFSGSRGGGYTDGAGSDGTHIQSAADGTANNTQNMQKYRFSPEEMRAIRECNRESFYYRCLPIGTTLGVGAYFGVRYGYLKPSARFGAGPKMAVASTIGYFLGKMSYQKVCAEKLMALPNSQLGEVLRQRKGQMGLQETLSMEPGFATAAPVGVPAFPNSDFSASNAYSDVGDVRPMNTLDNTSRNLGGYDNNRSGSNFDTTQQMLDDENLPAKRPQFFTSYDDLRRQNRIDSETKQHHPTPSGGPGSGASYNNPGTGYERRSQPLYPANDNHNQGKPTNKYGDVWDDKPSNY